VRAWIGLGGNRSDSADLLEAALERLAAEPGLELLRRSRPYRSPPWGYTQQPEFVNAVAEFESSLPPAQLLARLSATERTLGREPSIRRWGPRCIDLDLLTCGDQRLQSDELVLPHPRMHLRAFVLVPLLELDPGFSIPGIGPAAACLQAIDPRETAAVRPLELPPELPPELTEREEA